jgi:hypothetical protein
MLCNISFNRRIEQSFSAQKSSHHTQILHFSGKKQNDIDAARVFVRRGIDVGKVTDEKEKCDRAVLLFTLPSNDVARIFGVRRVRRVRESVDSHDDG